jgi:hypothetical protein
MTPKKIARIAGMLYLLSGIPGVFSYLYIPSTFMAMDATETVRRIAAMLRVAAPSRAAQLA